MANFIIKCTCTLANIYSSLILVQVVQAYFMELNYTYINAANKQRAYLVK